MLAGPLTDRMGCGAIFQHYPIFLLTIWSLEYQARSLVDRCYTIWLIGVGGGGRGLQATPRPIQMVTRERERVGMRHRNAPFLGKGTVRDRLWEYVHEIDKMVYAHIGISC